MYKLFTDKLIRIYILGIFISLVLIVSAIPYLIWKLNKVQTSLDNSNSYSSLEEISSKITELDDSLPNTFGPDMDYYEDRFDSIDRNLEYLSDRH